MSLERPSHRKQSAQSEALHRKNARLKQWEKAIRIGGIVAIPAIAGPIIVEHEKGKLETAERAAQVEAGIHPDSAYSGSGVTLTKDSEGNLIARVQVKTPAESAEKLIEESKSIDISSPVFGYNKAEHALYTGPLAGRKVSGYSVHFFGGTDPSTPHTIPSKIPSEVAYDTYRGIFEMKKKNFPNSPGAKSIDMVMESFDTHVANDTMERTSLTQVERELNRMAQDEMLLQLNEPPSLDSGPLTGWQIIQRDFALTPQGLATLQLLSKRIDGPLLLSYSMTEVSPMRGEDGVLWYSYMLQTYGKVGISHLVSLGDGYDCKGGWQFTIFPIPLLRKMNAAFPESLGIDAENIHLSTSYDEQGKAAFMFALSNLAVLINALEGGKTSFADDPKAAQWFKEASELLQNLDRDSFTALIAGMHHQPTTTVNATVKLLAETIAEAHPTDPDMSAIGKYANKAVKQYEERSKQNSSAYYEKVTQADSGSSS